MLLGRSNSLLSSSLLSSSLAAILLVSAAGLAMAQSDQPAAAQSAPAIGPPEAKTNGTSENPATPLSTPPATLQHNSTMGAASTDVPMPPVVTHILSSSDAAKFNATAAANDKRPTLAHALALTNEQRQLIAKSVAGTEESGTPDFKPEAGALMPKNVKLQDLPAEVTAKVPWIQPYKFALVGNEILLVDPGNSFVVVNILNR